MGLDDPFRQTIAINGKSVIHGYDLDLVCFKIFDGMIGAVMALIHLQCFCTQGQSPYLLIFVSVLSMMS